MLNGSRKNTGDIAFHGRIGMYGSSERKCTLRYGTGGRYECRPFMV